MGFGKVLQRRKLRMIMIMMMKMKMTMILMVVMIGGIIMTVKTFLTLVISIETAFLTLVISTKTALPAAKDIYMYVWMSLLAAKPPKAAE